MLPRDTSDDGRGCTAAPDAAVLKSFPADSATAVVGFTGHGAKPGAFSFFGLRNALPTTSVLLVRDPADSWYNAGLPGVASTVDEIAARIAHEVDLLGATRAVTIGSSMGGYAAILFGCKIGAERAVAFVPQTLLDPELPFHAPPAELDLQEPDLDPVIGVARQTKIDILVGRDNLVDVFHAQRVAAHPSVRVLGAPGGHSFATALYERGEYWPLVIDLIEGCPPASCEPKARLDPDTLERISTAVFAVPSADWHTVVDCLKPVVERFPGWAAPRRALESVEDHVVDKDGATRE